jgi:hypothetical protein
VFAVLVARWVDIHSSKAPRRGGKGPGLDRPVFEGMGLVTGMNAGFACVNI